MINRRPLCLLWILGASLALLASAAGPATAREFQLKGHAESTADCNRGARFRFEVIVKKGKFKKVKGFETRDLNYPNTLLGDNSGFPPPVGLPSPVCLAGPTGWTTHYWQDASILGNLGAQTSVIPFGIDPLGERHINGNAFKGVFASSFAGRTFETARVAGEMHPRRFKKTNKLKVTAHGEFVEDVGGEAGLEYGGASSGRARWKARAQ
jgi:hypothetical protein